MSKQTIISSLKNKGYVVRAGFGLLGGKPCFIVDGKGLLTFSQAKKLI